MRTWALPAFLTSTFFLTASQIVIAGVWIFHGLYSKLLGGIPRHQAIVSRVLGAGAGPVATRLIGLGEVGLGVWVLSGWLSVPCAILQTAALAGMNLLEVWRARDLLISAVGMLALNAFFLALVWNWAMGGLSR